MKQGEDIATHLRTLRADITDTLSRAERDYRGVLTAFLQIDWTERQSVSSFNPCLAAIGQIQSRLSELCRVSSTTENIAAFSMEVQGVLHALEELEGTLAGLSHRTRSEHTRISLRECGLRTHCARTMAELAICELDRVNMLTGSHRPSQ